MLIETLVEKSCERLKIPQAEIARRIGVDPQRLYNWKTYRRRMPLASLYKLITMAGESDLQKIVGQYAMEWHSVLVRQGKAEGYPELPERKRA